MLSYNFQNMPNSSAIITTTAKVSWLSLSLTHDSECPPILSVHIALYVWSSCVTKLKTIERIVVAVINHQ